MRIRLPSMIGTTRGRNRGISTILVGPRERSLVARGSKSLRCRLMGLASGSTTDRAVTAFVALPRVVAGGPTGAGRVSDAVVGVEVTCPVGKTLQEIQDVPIPAAHMRS